MADSIRFILNDEMREVSDLPPTTTVLQYLRMQERLTGTKEGCAEGDCGACTVIVGELVKDEVCYQAINACIAFLPTLDGKQVITVEHLKMNPVQQAMVACHGSQCGFCTPGFVMSLSALMHNKAKITDENIQDAIAGNLCRCTGYRPIIDAARIAAKAKKRNLSSNIKALKFLQRKETFSYEAPDGKFFAPRTMEGLADILARYPDATLLAGGTDVGLWVTKHHLPLKAIIYTAHVEELQQIRKTQAGLEIGGAVTYAKAFESLAVYGESFEELLRRFASVQIRNTGTIGGNIANGSPIGDGMPPLIALGAKLVVRSKKEARMMPLESFFIDYKKQDRKPGEFVEKIIVPPKPENVLFRVFKVSKRFDQDISAVCGAFALEIEKGKIKSARIVFGGMAATPKRADKTEKTLEGREWSEKTVRQAMAVLKKEFAPLTDMRASAEYRATVAGNLLYRFFLETTAPEIETEVYNYGEA